MSVSSADDGLEDDGLHEFDLATKSPPPPIAVQSRDG